MYPSLYLEDAKEFNSLGEGILKDTQSCYVVHERNGQFDLELEYLADSRLSNNLCKGKIIKADAGKRFQGQLFRIYKVNKTLENIIKVYAYHISYDLKYNPVSRIDLENVSCINALNSIKNSAILPFDFNFSTDITHTSNFNAEGKTALECLGGTEGSIIDNYGNGANIVRDNFNIKIMQNAGFDNNVLISYKKNMLSLDHDDEELQVTGVYPFVKEENGIDESNSTISSFLELPEKVIYREDYQDFKVQNVVPVDFSGKGITSVDSLRNNAISHLKAIVSDNISIKVDFLDKTKLDDYEGISSLQNLDVHDKVIVRYLKLDVNYKSSISKVKYNVLTEKYDEIEIGQTRTNLADTITDTDSFVKEEINKNTNFWQQAIEHATAQITGNSGGYVKMFPPNKPSEIFIMDKDDANLAVNVLRINKQGIGFSKNGINGPFETAWTADGTFYADYITAGTLIANIIKAGVLSDHNGNFELDLDNGTVKVNGEKFRVVVNGKEEGIVSQSQFTQTVDNFEFKFNQSGATNLVPQGRPRPGNYDGWAIENNAWFYTLNPSVLGFVSGDNGQEGYITSNPIETKNVLDFSMSIDVMVENNVVDCKVYVIGGVDNPYAYDQIIPIGICSPTNGWVSFKQSFTLNNNIKYVRVRIDNGGNKSVGNGGYVVWFDNVMLLEGLNNFPNYRENADNIYNNITSIDAEGVKVQHEQGSFSRMNHQEFYQCNESGDRTLALRYGGVRHYAFPKNGNTSRHYLGSYSSTTIGDLYGTTMFGSSGNGFLSFGFSEQIEDAVHSNINSWLFLNHYDGNGGVPAGVHTYRRLYVRGGSTFNSRPDFLYGIAFPYANGDNSEVSYITTTDNSSAGSRGLLIYGADSVSLGVQNGGYFYGHKMQEDQSVGKLNHVCYGDWNMNGYTMRRVNVTNTLADASMPVGAVERNFTRETNQVMSTCKLVQDRGEDYTYITNNADLLCECVVEIPNDIKYSIGSYDVSIIKYGRGDIWVSERNKDYFVVKSDNEIKFTWVLEGVLEDKIRLFNYDTSAFEVPLDDICIEEPISAIPHSKYATMNDEQIEEEILREQIELLKENNELYKLYTRKEVILCLKEL